LLKRKCGMYTSTLRRTKYVTRPKGKIAEGEIRQGAHRKWVLPPKKLFEGVSG